MKKIEIQKTSAAFILRYSRPMRTMYLVVSAVLFLIGMTASATPWLIYGAKPPAGMIFISIYAGIFAIGVPLFLICSGIGFRLVVDTKGVHRYSFNRVERSFLWRHIHSCGIAEIPPSENDGRVMLPSFYVSTEKQATNMKNCLFIRIEKQGEQAIRASGLLSFCHRQMMAADQNLL